MDDLFKTVQSEEKALLSAEIPPVIPPTIAERFHAAIERQYGPLPPARPQMAMTSGWPVDSVAGAAASRAIPRPMPNTPVSFRMARIPSPPLLRRLLCPLFLLGFCGSVPG